jgi:hypothetical protein
MMDDPVPNLVYLISRYVHIVATTLLVGGTLFYETVVPVAIGELRDPQQLSVFARARWTFKGIVWVSAILILLSGAVSAYRNTYAYFGDEVKLVRGEATTAASEERIRRARLSAPGWWAAAHSAGGLVTVGIALMLVSGRRPPTRPIGWMRLNLLLLLIVIFLASTSHYLRLKRVLPSRSVTSTLILPSPAVC